MKKITYRNRVPVADSEISAVELELDISFPESYRAFLGTLNGAVPSTNSIGVGATKCFGISRFIPLSKMVNEAEPFLGTGTLPIAWVDGGGYLLMDIQEGTIHYLDLDSDDFFKVADSMSGLLHNVIRTYTQDDIQLRPEDVLHSWTNPNAQALLAEAAADAARESALLDSVESAEELLADGTNITPSSGTLTAYVFENRKIGLQRSLFFDLHIYTSPFRLDSKIERTALQLNFVTLGHIERLDEISGREFVFPDAQHMDSSIYLDNEHRPVDVSLIRFGNVQENCVPIDISFTADLNAVYEFGGGDAASCFWSTTLAFDRESLESELNAWARA